MTTIDTNAPFVEPNPVEMDHHKGITMLRDLKSMLDSSSTLEEAKAAGAGLVQLSEEAIKTMLFYESLVKRDNIYIFPVGGSYEVDTSFAQ